MLIHVHKLSCHFEGGFCGAVTGVTNGFVESTTSVRRDGRVRYGCFVGFTLHGNPESRCLDNRIWDSQPTCTGTFDM